MLDKKDSEKVVISDEEDVVIINSDDEETKNNTKSIKLKIGVKKTKKDSDGIKRSVQLIKYSENIHSLTITRSGKIKRRHVECVINITDETEVVDLSPNNQEKATKDSSKCSLNKVNKEKIDCTFELSKIQRILPKCGRRSCGITSKLPCRNGDRNYKCIRRRYTTRHQKETNVNINYRSKNRPKPNKPTTQQQQKVEVIRNKPSSPSLSLSDLSLPSCLDIDKEYVYEDIESDDDFSSDHGDKLEMLIKRTKQREKSWTFTSNGSNLADDKLKQMEPELDDLDISYDSVSTVLIDDIGDSSKLKDIKIKQEEIQIEDMDISYDSVSTILLDDIGDSSKHKSGDGKVVDLIYKADL